MEQRAAQTLSSAPPCRCKYPNAQFTRTGNGIPISSNGTHFRYCPFLDSTSGNIPFGTVPKPQTGNLPLLVLDVTHFVPFPVLGYAISGVVIHWASYRNWTLCAWSHFRYRALPVPVRSFVGFQPELNNMRVRYAHWWVCGKCAHDNCDGATGKGRRATKLTTMAMEQRDTMTMTMVTDVGIVDDDYDANNTSWTMSNEGDNHQG